MGFLQKITGLFSSEKEYVELDKIAMVLIPRILDDNPKIFLEHKLYLEYSMDQAETFMKSLPHEAQGDINISHVSKDNLRIQASPLDEKSAFYKINSPYQVGLGFLPDYFVIYDSIDIHAPRFFLTFFPIEREPSRKIIELALNQFYLHETALSGKLLAMGSKNDEHVLMGLDCLRNYLPKGTKIEGRCNEMLANLSVKYKI